MQKEKHELKAVHEKRNEELEAFNNILEEKKKIYYESQSQHQGVLEEVKLFEEKILNLEETINRLDKEILQKNQYVKESQLKIENQRKSIALLKEEEKDINSKISAKEIELTNILNSVVSDNNKLKELEEVKFKYYNNINSKTSEIDILKNNIQIINESIENLILDIQTFRNSILINNKTKDNLVEEENRVSINIAKYEEEVKENRKNLSKCKHNLEILEKNLKEIVREQGNKEARLNALITLENSYEGYNRSVKLLMQHIENSKEYRANEDCYVLGDIIKVSERFERAIEIAMGSSISNIVTRDEVIAKNLINHLKSSKIGRATFMPINIVKGKNVVVDRAVMDAKGYIGVASELIEFEGKFKGVIDQVLGKTLVCDTMDNGLSISKISGYRYRIVTLYGEVFNPGGSLTGGSYSKNANVIGRKREIEELTEQVKESHEIVANKNEEITAFNAKIKELDDIGLNLKDEIHYENINITKIKGEISKVTEKNLEIKESFKGPVLI